MSNELHKYDIGNGIKIRNDVRKDTTKETINRIAFTSNDFENLNKNNSAKINYGKESKERYKRNPK